MLIFLIKKQKQKQYNFGQKLTAKLINILSNFLAK